jgi:hypothetical protein
LRAFHDRAQQAPGFYRAQPARMANQFTGSGNGGYRSILNLGTGGA